MWYEIRAFFKDLKHVGALGPGFLIRHPLALAGQTNSSFDVRNVGRVHVRYRDSDSAVLRQVFSRGEYDLSKYPQKARLDAAYARIRGAGKKPIIIDAGANVGFASIWFTKLYPDAKIIAIEPDPANLEIARKNLAPFPNVKLIAGAIGAKAGRVDLTNPTGESYGVRTERAETGATPILTVPDLAAEAGPDGQLFIVKVDIEGFESDLFTENLDWLDQTSGLIVEIHDWMLPGQYSSASLQKAVFPRGFEMLIYRESLVFVR